MRLLFPLLGLLCSLSAIARGQDSLPRHLLSYQMLATDYCSLDPQYRRERAARPRFLYPDDVNYAAELGYQYQYNRSFNLKAAARIGSVDAYHLQAAEGDTSCQPCSRRFYPQEFFGSLELNGLYKFNNGRLLPLRSLLQPYVAAGLSLVYFDKRTQSIDLQIPLGIGLKIPLHPQFSLQSQSEIRASLRSQKHNLAISVGFLWSLR